MKKRWKRACLGHGDGELVVGAAGIKFDLKNAGELVTEIDFGLECLLKKQSVTDDAVGLAKAELLMVKLKGFSVAGDKQGAPALASKRNLVFLARETLSDISDVRTQTG